MAADADPSVTLTSLEGAQRGPDTSVSGPLPLSDIGDSAPRVTVLGNGLRVVTEFLPHTRSVSLGYWVGVGSRDEPSSVAGVSHFLEHLVFKGTEGRSAHAIAEAVDAVGGEMNAFTTKEHTAFYMRLPDHAFGMGLDLLGEVLSSPALRAADVDAERQVILEEIALDEDDPDERAQTLSHELLFPDHPLGREVAGSVETIESMSPGDIADFFARWYGPTNLVVAAAGAVDHEAVVHSVDAHFGSLAAGERPERRAPGPTVPGEVQLARQVEQDHLVMAWRAPDAHSLDRFPLAVLNHVLGGGMSARLFQEIREKRGLAYSTYSYSALYGDAGCLMAYAATSPAHLDAVRGLIDHEVERMATDGITDRELRVAKGYLQGALVLGLEDSASRMVRIGASTLTHDEVVPLDVHLRRLDSVTAEDVARVAAEVFQGPKTVSIVGHI